MITQKSYSLVRYNWKVLIISGKKKINYPMKTSPRSLLTYVQIMLQTLAVRIHGQEGVIIATGISGSAQISGPTAKYM